MKLTAGTTLQSGKYLVNHVLGQGGSSITLKGTLVPLNHSVILKTFSQELRERPNFSLIQQQFQEQVSLFARCQHPALVRLIDSFEEGGLPFAVMDYTSGPTLAEVVKTKGSIPEDLAIHYIQQVGSALAAIHQHGLTHHHVSPDSIIQPPGSNVVVLVNYRLIDPVTLGENHNLSSAISPYAAIADPSLHSSATPATDIYSLAATLYFLLTGQPPVAATLRHQTPLVPPRQLRPQLSEAITAALLSGLEMNAKLRPQSVTTWLALLPTSKPEPWIPVDTHALISAAPTPTINDAANPHQPLSQLPTQVPASLNGKVDSNGNGNGNVNSKPIQSPQAIYPAAVPKRTSYPSVHPPQPITRSSSKHFSRVLLTISAIAATAGLGGGMLLRLAAGSSGPGSSLFHSEQAFPSIPDWPNAATPVAPSTSYSPPQEPSVKEEPLPQRVTPAVEPNPQPAAKAPAPSPNPDPVEATPLPEQTPASATDSIPTPNPSAELPDSQPASEPLPPPIVESPPTSVAPKLEEPTPVNPATP